MVPEFHTFQDFLDWISREVVKEMGKGRTVGSSHKVTSAKVKTKECEDHAN